MVTHDKIPIVLLTGFLGSGKTTLLNQALQLPELKDTAVLINEFGDVALDHHLIEQPDNHTVVLGNGCICCTVRGELVGALNSLWKRRMHYEIPSFNRVIIETTGLADPAPILQELLAHPLVRQHYQLTGVLTCVDAVLGDGQLDQEIEALKQAAVADRLIMTKTDLVTSEQKIALLARLHALNPVADILFPAESPIDPEWFLRCEPYDIQNKSIDVAQWLHAEKYRQLQSKPSDAEKKGVLPKKLDMRRGKYTAATSHDERIHAFSLCYESPVEWNKLLKGLQMLIAMKGDHLLRIKGIVDAAGEDQPRVLHVVQHLIFETQKLTAWTEQRPRATQLVFIVRDLDETFVQLSLDHFMGI